MWFPLSYKMHGHQLPRCILRNCCSLKGLRAGLSQALDGIESILFSSDGDWTNSVLYKLSFLGTGDKYIPGH